MGLHRMEEEDGNINRTLERKEVIAVRARLREVEARLRLLEREGQIIRREG
jgi:hypothetical protein